MPGITSGASRWAVSAGAVLVFGGGLALYQMTSLVLGPAGSRELHLSLAIPAVELDALSAPVSSGVNHMLGTLAAPAPAPSVSARAAAPHRAPGRPAAPRASVPAAQVPAPVVARPPARPVASPTPTPYGSGDPATQNRDDDH